MADTQLPRTIVQEQQMVNVAVVGAGYWGPNLVRNFARTPWANLVACADPRPERLERLARDYPLRLTTSYRELLEDQSIEAVAIATPAATHYRLVKESLECGKHVLVEKPLATSLQQGEELVRLADRQGRVLMVDHIFLYNPAVEAMKEIICKGELGQVRYLYALRTSLGPRLCEDTNVVWDAQIHEVYILMNLFETLPTRVIATGGAYLRQGIEDVVFTTLFFEDDVIAHCHNTSYAPLKMRRMVIVGSEKMLVYDDLNVEERIVIYERGYAPFEGIDLLGNHNLRLYDQGHYAPAVEWREPLRVECQHFIECIKNGSRPRTDGRSALKVLAVLEAIDKSLKDASQPIRLTAET
jgi:predicted dehydrogenase